MRRSTLVKLTMALLTVLGAAPSAAQTARQRTYANPIDIDYRYNFEQLNEGISYRSGADPVIVVQRGEYYLFETIGNGYWHSTDLGTWRHVTPSRWPLTDIVAPAALSVRDTIYLLPSITSPLPILMLTEPASGRVEFYNRLLPWLPMARYRETEVLAKPDSVQPGPWDPAFFHDPDTDRWFLYWNSSNAYPLHAIELDKSKRLAYRGTPKWLFGLEPELHGWERFGRDHRDTTINPFIEGAWMTKHAGRYYLQYGAPGTEYNVYATGVYVGDNPLGPFTYAPYNPVAYKPGGFVQGAGHGNTFQDVFGNWWNTGTPWIGVNWNFERRIGLHPTGFDSSGQMYVDTRFGDFPHWLPTKPWRTSEDLFTGWMLLSYRKPATASSTLDTFPASRITDENPRTFWVAGQNRPGEWLTIDLGRVYDLKAVQVNYADYKSGLYGTDSTVVTQFRLHSSVDGRQWKPIADLSRERRDRPNAYIELETPVRARFVRYEHVRVGAANLAISDIRVFGNGSGARPLAPAGLTARRDRDERNAVITWRPIRGVVGYNVRWGISPSKLYQTYQRFADQETTLELRALSVGQAYWAAIESFDENGVSTLSAPAPIVLRDTMTTRAPFGHLPDGRAVELFTLTNRHGVEVRVMTYGGIITVIRTPDRSRQIDDIVLGFDSLAGYLKESPYFGAIVGRYANRIANGQFTLDGTTYRLVRNNGPNTLHGGVRGFDKVLWSGEPFQGDSGVGVTLRYTSGDGEEGFPGTLVARVTYTLTPRDELVVDFEATSDKATPVNLSQHTYWNLRGTAGGGGGDILDHVLTLDAAAFTPVDASLIPTGEIAPVAGTPFDFRAGTKVGARIGQENEQLRFGRGYDHNWKLDRSGPGLVHAARLVEPVSGRTLDVSTTEPGVQFYSGNFLDGTIQGKGGRVYTHRSGLCLETQHFPDSPNRPGFPSTILRPGATYRSRTVFTFGVVR